MNALICLSKLIICISVSFTQFWHCGQSKSSLEAKKIADRQHVNASPHVETILHQSYKSYNYEDISGSIVIKLPSGNDEQASFILDTGSPTLLSEVLAKRLNLTLIPVSERYTVSNDQKQRFVGLTKLANTHFGQWLLGGKEVLIVNSKALPMIGGHEIMGVLGYDIFSHGVLLIDPSKKSITVWNRADVSTGVLTKLGMTKALVQPLTPLSTGAYGIRVVIGDIPVMMRIDTGATRTVLTNKLAQQLKLSPYEAIQRDTFFGRIDARRSKLHTLVIGRNIYHNIDIEYPSTADFPLPPLLGMDILTRFRVLLDFSSQRIYLLPVLLTDK